MYKSIERKDRPRFKALDLFAGCGGLTLGLRQSDFEVLGAVEFEKTAIEGYQANHPETRLYPLDIRDLPPEEAKRGLGLRKGGLDLLAGCPPCQGFSSMRTLNGGRRIQDERNDLIFDFLKFAVALEPKTIIMENVPALARDGRLQFVIGRLEEMGYRCKVGVLDAADFGVPQRRRRMLLIASRLGRFDFPPHAGTKTTVRHAIGSLPPPGQSGDPLHDHPCSRAPHVMEMIRAIPKDGGSRSDLGEDRQLACHRKCDGFKDIYGRMKWDDVAPTITSGCINPSKGRFLHPEQDRAITLREASLLQGFTPDYVFPVERGRYPVAGLIGNAVPAAFVKHQVSVLTAQLGRYHDKRAARVRRSVAM
ncbi:MAG: DNA cytosine methyltransferase [Isosphaeraceae bacterium]